MCKSRLTHFGSLRDVDGRNCTRVLFFLAMEHDVFRFICQNIHINLIILTKHM